MLEARLDEILELRHVMGHLAADEAGARRRGQRAGSKCRLRCCRGVVVVSIDRGGRRYLSAGHAVDLVVEHQAGDSRLRRQAWIRWLPPIARQSPSPVITTTCRSGRASVETGGVGERSAVSDVKCIGVDVGRDTAGTADAADDCELVLVDAEFVQRPQQRAQRDAVAAARAQEMRHQLQAQIVPDRRTSAECSIMRASCSRAW